MNRILFLIFLLSSTIANSHESFHSVVEQVKNHIVHIEITHKKTQSTGHPLNNEEIVELEGNSSASGVVINGYERIVITNAHILPDVKDIQVSFADGTKFNAHVIGMDKNIDIAVLFIEGSKELLKDGIKIGNVSDLKRGDWVLIFGSALGLEESISHGIISNLDRITYTPIIKFIQTDASLNRGNSGGAMVNTNGELVGIPSNYIHGGDPTGGSSGISLVIPVDIAMRAYNQIKEFGSIKPGTIGVQVDTLTLPHKIALGVDLKTSGAIIMDIQPESSADLAGLSQGDVITKFCNRSVNDLHDLIANVYLTRPGTTCMVEFNRGPLSMARLMGVQ